jgi:hypothetical protein
VPTIGDVTSISSREEGGAPRSAGARGADSVGAGAACGKVGRGANPSDPPGSTNGLAAVGAVFDSFSRGPPRSFSRESAPLSSSARV